MFNDRSQNTERGVTGAAEVVALKGAGTLTSLGCCRDVRWEGCSYLAEYVPKHLTQGDNIMKKSLIWITAGIAAVGFGVPAFAARGDAPRQIVPAQVTVATATPTTETSNSVDSARVTTVTAATTVNTVEDISGPCDEAEHANDPRCAGVTVASTQNSIDDNATDNSVDDDATDNSVEDNATNNSVEDISGPCDEAEHANDPRCTGVNGSSSNDDSGHNGSDDNSGRGGSDDSGHGGSDDS
jgi:hypothetical protein